MKKYIHVLFLSIAVLGWSGISWGAGLTHYKEQCADFGYKKGTEKFGSCVLELRRRDKGSQAKTNQVMKEVASGDGSVEDQNCQRFGFNPGTLEYSNCRMQLSVAADTARRELAVYEEQKRAHDAEVARVKKAKNERANLALLQAGLCMLAGPTECAKAEGRHVVVETIAPSVPYFQNFSIQGADGFNQNCQFNTRLNHVSCR
jgi:hypothetical protein